jgi:long-chain acyl-CoA synthetase
MLVESLLEAARQFPNKIAAQDPLRRLTFSQMATLARVLRRVVLAETNAPRVGFMLPASSAAMGTFHGILWAGRTAIPLNFLLQAPELKTIIADAGLDLVLGVRPFEPLLSQLGVRTLYLEDLGIKRRFVWERFRRTPEPPRVDPQDTAIIIYTSGTTGQPKGACLTHRGIAWDNRTAIEQLRLDPAQHLLGIIPPFHVFGMSVLNFLPVALGASVTFIPRFSPQATYQAIATGGVSLLVAVPSMYAAIARLKNLDLAAFRNVRLAISGGEPLPRPVYETVLERTGMHLIEGYGMTETSPIISVDVPWALRTGSVGFALPGIDLQLRNENGEVLFTRAHGLAGQAGANPTSSTEGELHVRGPLVMRGYLNRPADTAAVIDSQGWFRTGDIVRLDTDGHMSITGRAKDLIIVGGENVYPREVENVLESHPAVGEVAVVGRPDSSRGEVVVAFVVAREGVQLTPDELRSFCREHLAGYKTPREIHLRPELPRGPTGKIIKSKLMAELAAAAAI